MIEDKVSRFVIIIITFLLRTQVYCQQSNSANRTEASSSSTTPFSTSPPAPESNTPNSVTILSSSSLEENPTTIKNALAFTPPPTTPTPLTVRIVSQPPRLPTVLQEAATDIPYSRGRGRDRSRNRSRDRDDRRNRNFNRNRNDNTPDRFLRKLMGLGSRFIARSLSLVTGDEVSESTENKFRRFENPEDVGSARNSSGEEVDSQPSLNDKWRNLNPVQLLLSRFQIKANKMERWRQVKDNFRKKELDRRVDFFRDDSGDFVTRNIRNLVKSLANRYEKETETLGVYVDFRRQRLARFLEIPLVASILGNNNGAGQEIKTTTTTQTPPTDSSLTSLEELNVNESRRDDYDEDGRNDQGSPPIFNPIAEISRKVLRFIRNL